MFNEMMLQERILSGEFTVIVDDAYPVSKSFLQPGSTAQIESYYDSTGQHVTTVHYYRQPDNTIGASGQMDPTYIYKDGVIFKWSKKMEDAGKL